MLNISQLVRSTIPEYRQSLGCSSFGALPIDLPIFTLCGQPREFIWGHCPSVFTAGRL